MNISQQFSPPPKYVLPYFFTGTLFYLLSLTTLFFVDISQLSFMDRTLVSFVHLFLIAFVMMNIFGSTAQIMPVVFEAGHHNINTFYAVWSLLSFGVFMMVIGFLLNNIFIPLGGTTVLFALIIYLYNFFLTAKKTHKHNFILKTIIISNIFLFVGVLTGIYMAMGDAALIDIEFIEFLPMHMFILIGGFIFLTIMGIALVLLPMFGTSRGFTHTPIKIAVVMMIGSVVSIILSTFLHIKSFQFLGYILSISSLSFFTYQVYLIYKRRIRKDFDLYIKSLLVAGGSLLSAIILFVVYLFSEDMPLLYGGFWMLFVGFFTFTIMAHLYKIVPFLVWLHRFSPCVGEKEVPMIYEMYSEKAAHFQLLFSLIGLILAGIGIIVQYDSLFKAGVSSQAVGSVLLVFNMFHIIKVR